MNIEAHEFPLVRLGYDAGEHIPTQEVLARYSALLKREKPFVFLSEGDMDNGNDDVAERKKVSLWMKANKSDIRRLVKGHVHVQPDTAKRFAAKAFAVISEKFWGYPMFIVANAEEARSKAAQLLAS